MFATLRTKLISHVVSADLLTRNGCVSAMLTDGAFLILSGKVRSGFDAFRVAAVCAVRRPLWPKA